MELFGTRLVARLIGDRQRSSQPGTISDERPFPKQREIEEVERSPRPLEREVDHRLAELVFKVDILDEVRLIDDVHEVPRLGDAPEHLPDTGK